MAQPWNNSDVGATYAEQGNCVILPTVVGRDYDH